MKQFLNTLYVMTQGAYVCLDHETVKIEVEGKVQLQVPLHHLGAIVTMGNVMMSPFIMARCADDGRAVVILDRNGQFKCRMVGKTSGNVLLRQAQYEAVREQERTLAIARNIVAGKVKNARQILLRGIRESDNEEKEEIDALKKASDTISNVLFHLKDAKDIDEVRGFEGEAAEAYFQSFDRMVKKSERKFFTMNGRSRRPPLDPVNSLLSFLYTLLLNDCVSALEGVGLDSQMGFLHALRPGRPSLGLDLMEEFRSILADRLALTLINRKQVTAKHFESRPGGAIYLNDEGRKAVVVAYQKRKQDEFHHPILDSKAPFGLIPHIQARLLARHLRGDLEAYTPVLYS
ncbi:MAG: type I-C CRISPR-associated endonuclease Cas1c [bacterium]